MTRSLISISLMRFPLSLAHGGATYSVCSLPPCGQGNRIWVNKYESLTERTESKSSEIPVLFTHMRLPCPCGGGLGRGSSLLREVHAPTMTPTPNPSPLAGATRGRGTHRVCGAAVRQSHRKTLQVQRCIDIA